MKHTLIKSNIFQSPLKITSCIYFFTQSLSMNNLIRAFDLYEILSLKNVVITTD